MLNVDSRLPVLCWVLLAASSVLAVEKSDSFHRWDALSPVELGEAAEEVFRDGREWLRKRYQFRTLHRVECIRTFSAYVASRYGRAGAADQVLWPDWLKVAALFGEFIPCQTREAMGEDLAGVVAAQAPEAGIPGAHWGSVCDALVSLDRLSLAGRLALQRADQPKGGSAVPLAELPGIARALASAPEACGGDAYWSARRKLARHLAENVLNDEATIRSIPWSDWLGLTTALEQDFSIRDRQVWMEKLARAHAASREDDPPAGPSDFVRAFLAVSTDRPDVLAEWMCENRAWRQWSGCDFSELAIQLAKSKSQVAKDARAELLGHLINRYLSNPEVTRRITGNDWKVLGAALHRAFSDRQRTEWIRGLNLAFFDDEAVMGGLDEIDYSALIEAVVTVRPEDGIKRAAEFIEESDAWKNWSLDLGLIQLAFALRASTDERRDVRLILAEHLLNNWTQEVSLVRPPAATVSTWLHIVTHFGSDLSEGQRLQLGERLTRALLHDAERLTWSLENDEGCFIRLDEMLEPLMGMTLGDYLYDRHLADASQTEKIPPALWARLARRLEGYLEHSQKVAWVRGLRGAFLNEDGSPALSGEDMGQLILALGALRDTDADQLAVVWVNSCDAWRNWPAEELRHLSRLLVLPPDGAEDEDLARARRRLQQHIVEQLLIHPAAVREAGCGPWVELTAHLAADISDDQKFLWASRLSAAYVGNAEALIRLTLDQRQGLSEVLAALSQPRRAQVIRKIWVAESPEVMFADRMLGPELWNIELRLLFSRVIAAEPGTRPKVWRHGVKRLLDYPVALSPQACRDLKRLTEFREFQNKAVPEQIVDDLIAMCRDEVSTPQLETIRNKMRLQEALADAPGDFAELIGQAESLRNSGRAEEAAAPLGEAIERFGQAGRAGVLARRMLIELLLDQGMSGAEEVRRHLEVIAQDDTAGEEFLWNARCRLLMREVCAAPPPDRSALWRGGLESLEAAADGVLIYEKTLKDVDRFVGFLQSDQTLTLAPLKALTDLMLLTPHRQSMRSLQARRVVAFSKADRDTEASAAFRLDVLLSAGGRGPVECVGEVEAVLASAGQSDIGTELLEGPLGPSRQAPQPAAPATDPALVAAAKARLGELGPSARPRRLAWLSLLAGDAEGALDQGRLALSQAGDTRAELREAFEDLAAMVAVADGRIASCHRLTRSFIEPGGGPRRADEAAVILEAWSRKLASWAVVAAQQGRDRLAGALWGLSVASRPQEEACVAAEVICNAGRRLYASERFLEMLRAMAPHVRKTRAGEAPLRTMASVLYEASRPQECLEVLDRLETLKRQTGTTSPVADGVLRAVCLIDLGRYDQAVEWLKEIADWEATQTEQAQVLFLTGWALFQAGDRQEALAAFKRARASSPSDTFTERAERLIHLLEGGAS